MIVFCEYVIPEVHREAFLQWADQHAELRQGAEWMENMEQPGVFVEIWRAADGDKAERIKKERLNERSKWRQMDVWVKGGRDGLRMWTFAPVRRD